MGSFKVRTAISAVMVSVGWPCSSLIVKAVVVRSEVGGAAV